VALSALVERLPSLWLAAGERELRWKRGTVMRSLKELPVTW
jgi:hypothetical protein